MTVRARRFLVGAAIVVAALFVGRWAAAFLAERWWAATISPAALSAVTNWWLLGFFLNVSAIVIASSWFVLQAIAIARTVTAIHITRHIGNLEVREAIPTRLLFWGAVLIGALLGWIAGAGADSWRAPIALAWQGVTWGITDPLLHADLGTFVTRFPVREIIHEFLLTLIVVGLAFTVTLYLAIGAIRRVEQRVQINPLARRHIGNLLSLLALVIAIGYLMDPMRIAASEDLGGSLVAARLRINVSYWSAAMASVTIVLSVLWGMGRKPLYLLSGWGALVVTMIGVSVLLPSRAVPLEEEREIAALNTEFTAHAWGLSAMLAPVERDSFPPVTTLWDERLLRRAEGVKGFMLLAATPMTWTDAEGTPAAAWLEASIDTSGRIIDVKGVEEGVTGDGGGPNPVPNLLHRVESPHTWPRAPSWQRVSEGVSANTVLSRLMLAWARQAGGVLSLSGKTAIDWHLDPTERAGAILPMARWLAADVGLDGNRPVWIVQGLIPLDEFPLSTRWRRPTGSLAGLLPAFIAIVDAASGATRFYLDPVAGPVAQAWARFAPNLIIPADSMPPGIRRELPYAPAWADVQLEMRRMLRNRGDSPNGTLTPYWAGPSLPGWQEVLSGNQIVTIRREQGLPVWTLDQSAIRGTGFRADVESSFSELPLLQHFQDSITASGDSATFGQMRWWHGAGLPVVWQPIVVLDHDDGPRLLGIATEQRHQANLSRSLSSTWQHGTGLPGKGTDTLAKNAAALTQARYWMALADSALRRGDLTAFGRYFESLQKVLAGGKP